MKELRKGIHKYKLTVSKTDKGKTTVTIDNDNRSFFCCLNDKHPHDAYVISGVSGGLTVGEGRKKKIRCDNTT
jgi:hypothetical protein